MFYIDSFYLRLLFVLSTHKSLGAPGRSVSILHHLVSCRKSDCVEMQSGQLGLCSEHIAHVYMLLSWRHAGLSRFNSGVCSGGCLMFLTHLRLLFAHVHFLRLIVRVDQCSWTLVLTLDGSSDVLLLCLVSGSTGRRYRTSCVSTVTVMVSGRVFCEALDTLMHDCPGSWSSHPRYNLVHCQFEFWLLLRVSRILRSWERSVVVRYVPGISTSQAPGVFCPISYRCHVRSTRTERRDLVCSPRQRAQQRGTLPQF